MNSYIKIKTYLITYRESVVSIDISYYSKYGRGQLLAGKKKKDRLCHNNTPHFLNITMQY